MLTVIHTCKSCDEHQNKLTVHTTSPQISLHGLKSDIRCNETTLPFGCDLKNFENFASFKCWGVWNENVDVRTLTIEGVHCCHGQILLERPSILILDLCALSADCQTFIDILNRVSCFPTFALAPLALILNVFACIVEFGPTNPWVVAWIWEVEANVGERWWLTMKMNRHVHSFVISHVSLFASAVCALWLSREFPT